MSVDWLKCVDEDKSYGDPMQLLRNLTHALKLNTAQRTMLFPEAIDGFVTEDNPIIVIDLFVDQFDLLELGFEAVNAKLTGRPGYPQSDTSGAAKKGIR
jgi:hypothetical protein